MQALGILAIILVPFLTGTFTVKALGFMEKCFMKLGLRKKEKPQGYFGTEGRFEESKPQGYIDTEGGIEGSKPQGYFGTEEKVEGLNPIFTYVSGLLTLIFLFLCVHLAGLKLDVDLKKLEKLFFVPAAGLSLLGVIFWAVKVKPVKHKKTSGTKSLGATSSSAAPSATVPSTTASKRIKLSHSLAPVAVFNKANLFFIIPAVLLGVVSYFIFAPSYVNDDTWEVVSTTVYHGTLYEYSAMTGDEVIKGFPIFYKIYVIPMLYSCLCDFFNLPQRLLMGFLMPSILLFLNLNIIYAIARESHVKNKPVFMLLYMLLLMAGTYLPDNAIPATVGYALLREGYSGYAYAYAIAIPFSVFLFIKKKHFSSVLSLTPILCLVRLDRIFYALGKPLKTYVSINTAGKLIGLYLAAIAVLAVMRLLKRTQTAKALFFLPIVLIAYTGERILTLIDGKRAKALYLLSLSFIIFAAGNFSLYKDAELLSAELDFEKSVREELKDYSDTEIKIWASEDFMATARRILPNIRTLIGRDDITGMLNGLDYEEASLHTLDFYNSYKNMHSVNASFYPSDLSVEEAMEEAYKEGMDLYIP